MAEVKSQANSPFYTDKSFWLVIFGALLPLLSRWIGIDLNVEEIAAMVATIISFVVMNKWKSGKIVVEELKAAQAAKIEVPAIPAEEQTPAGVSDAINKL